MPESPMNQFQAFLQQKGLRLTRERRLVAEIVFSLAPPFDEEAILKAVNGNCQQRVSRSAVYRTLTLIEESGVVSIESRSSGILTPLCESAHAKLIAGRCPWCGRNITHGQPVDPG